MTASAPERLLPGTPARVLLALLLLAGCRTPAAVPAGSPLEPLPALGVYVPEAADRAARDVAAAALGAGPQEVRAAQALLLALDRQRRESGEAPTGLAPAALELEAVTRADPLARRAATRELLERDDLAPETRRRIQQELEDDPLRLADRRLADARRARFARRFNAIAEPVGRSLLSTALAPYRLGRALLTVVAQRHLEEPISVPERQALAHWKRYVEAHPSTPEAARLVKRIEKLQGRWYSLKRERNLQAAQAAFRRDDPALALVLADRVLRYAPEDREATLLRERAAARLARLRADRRRSLEASERPPPDAVDARARGLALALLDPRGDVAGAARRLRDAGVEAPLAEAGEFAQALALAETGAEAEAWKILAGLARRDPEHSHMARHAEALVERPAQNPLRAFGEARRAERRRRSAWLLLGPLAEPRQRELPAPLAWSLGAFSLVEVVAGLPMRLLRLPFAPRTDEAVAVHARHYLALHPRGQQAEGVRSWLVKYEIDRGNAIAAHRLAAEAGADARELTRLEEQAAEQMLETALRQKRPDVRAALLRQAASTHPQTEAGRRAGTRLRQELEEATTQRIRISRGFLLENPEVAGPAGLGLRAELLDGEPRNGELHPEGVLLLGGRTLEFALLEVDADPDAAPRRVRRRVSEERLARIVSQLEEATLRNALLDPDAVFEPDADRDLFFERARFGLADRPDLRATAQSSYAFRGMRERYGLVRRRESILPVELVIQGSFPDLGLGAFPRVPLPRPTPDAILYR